MMNGERAEQRTFGQSLRLGALSRGHGVEVALEVVHSMLGQCRRSSTPRPPSTLPPGRGGRGLL